MVACLLVDIVLLSMDELAMTGVKIYRGEVFELAQLPFALVIMATKTQPILFRVKGSRKAGSYE